MTIRLSTGFRDKMLGDNPFRTIFENGVIYVYSGVQPTSADNAVQGTKLGEITQDGGDFTFGSATNGLLFDAPSNGEIVKDPSQVWQMVAEADGTVGWGRLMGNAIDNLAGSQTLPRVDFSIGGSSADLSLNNTSVSSGATVTIDNFRYRIPAS